MCNHAVEHLIGTGDGIKCRLCGKVFKAWKELEADRPQEEKPVEEKTEAEKQEEEIDETLKAVKEKKKATTKKGAKK